MAVKLHRCSATWLRADFHPCWRVQKVLDEAEVDYEVVKHSPVRFMRKDVEELSGQHKLPLFEFEDGSVLREESRDLVERIREGKLEKPGGLRGLLKRD